MNNEQNNGIFNIPNQNPVQSNNNGFNAFNTSSGVTQSEQSEVNSAIDGIIPVQPIPSVVVENPNGGVVNNAGVGDATAIIPNVVNTNANDSFATTNVNPNSNVVASSSFDIGLNSASNMSTQQDTVSTMPIDSNINSVSNGVANNVVLPGNGLSFGNQEKKQSDNLMVNSNGGSNLNNSNSKNNVSNGVNDNIVSVGKYLGYIVLFCIPIVGFVMLIVKAFFDKKDKNISNLAKAQLLLSVIGVVIAIIFMIISFAAAGSMINQINDNANSYIDQNNYGYTYDY